MQIIHDVRGFLIIPGEEDIKKMDYKERFKVEYAELKERYDKLHKMLVKYEAGTLDFKPTCSIELLKEQASYMGNYLRVLEIRAEIEKIEI